MHRPIDVAEYIPAPYPVPTWVKDKLLQIGGKNKYGEPMLRVVWGADAKHLRFGKMLPKYVSAIEVETLFYTEPGKRVGNATEVRTFYGLACWIIEEWVGPEVLCPIIDDEFGVKRDLWEERRFHRDEGTGEIEDVLGPAPRNGEYRYLCKLANDRQYLDLEPSLFEAIAQVYYLRRNGQFPTSEQEYREVVEGIQKQINGRIDDALDPKQIENEYNSIKHIIDNPHRARRGGSGKRAFLGG